jgi:hypothetical protein
MEASNNRNNPHVGFSETLHKEAPNIVNHRTIVANIFLKKVEK